MSKFDMRNRIGQMTSPKTADDYLSAMLGENTNTENIQQINIDLLVEYDNHPFKPYKEEKLQELAKDIEMNGILSPIIIRPHPLKQGLYQILSGHNRVNASHLLKLQTVPALVKNNIDDITAQLIMVNSNLNQRQELLPSEKSFAYKMQLDALKQQGKRTDLTSRQVGTKSQTDKNSTSGQIDRKLNAYEDITENATDSERTIRRYIRLTHLILPLLDMVDNGKLKFTIAVDLSYLSKENQEIVFQHFDCGNIINAQKAQMLKEAEKNGELTESKISEILTSVRKEKTTTYSISKKIVKKYKLPDNPKERNEILEEALELYFSTAFRDVE